MSITPLPPPGSAVPAGATRLLEGFTGRTLTVSSPAMPQLLGQPALRFLKLSGAEQLSRLYEYSIELRTPDDLAVPLHASANLDLKAMLGQDMTVSIQLDGMGSGVLGGIGAGTREISGLVTQAAFLRRESSYNVYRVILRPWLWLATRTTDFKIFQNKNVIEILDEVLADYPYPVEKRLDVGKYAIQTDSKKNEPRNFQVQYGETDYDFCQRLMEEYGIAYFFSHDNGKHRLILTDHAGAYRKSGSAAYQTLAYQPEGGKTDAEHITRFRLSESLRSGTHTHTDYNFVQPGADLTTLNSQPREHRVDDAEIYEWPGNYTDRDHGDFLNRVRMEELRAKGSRAKGKGHIRGLACGQTFTLTGHPQDAANREYLVIRSRLELEDIGEESGSTRQYLCVNKFLVQPASEVFRPERITPRPKTSGPQSATVVGPGGQEIWTDEYARVKVRFHWDRYARSDETDSCWIRVSSPWQGSQYGAVHTPRINQEVLVDFIDGDPEKPIITGRAPNRNNPVQWQYPGQQYISGFVSKEVFGQKHNVWLKDDTPGKIQTQLRSDHLASGLHMGYLNRISEPAGRQDDRGEGAELRSDGIVSARAGRGLLLTTHGRPGGSGNAFNVDEINAQLADAQETAEQIAQTATTAGAQEDEQTKIAKALKAQAKAIQGGGPLKEFTRPQLAIASPAGITATADDQIYLASGKETAITTGTHFSVSSGGGFFASTRKALRLFVYEAGMRLIAAAGDIDIKALKDSINLLAKLNVTVAANKIKISAVEEVEISGGGSYTRWNSGGIRNGTQGSWQVHSASRALTGPENVGKPVLPESEPEKENLHAALRALPGEAHTFTDEPYELFKGGTKIGQGVTDEFGRVLVKDHQPGTPAYTVKLANGGKFDLKVKDVLNSDVDHIEQLTNKGERKA